jgi:hypothetical protein
MVVKDGADVSDAIPRDLHAIEVRATLCQTIG